MTLRAHPVLAALLAATFAIGLAGCGDDDDGGSDGEGGDTPRVLAQGIAYADDLTVAPGAEFIFDNQDATVHTLTADAGEFDSGEVPGANQSDPMTAPEDPGDYAFHCEIHASMTGTLTVEG